MDGRNKREIKKFWAPYQTSESRAGQVSRMRSLPPAPKINVVFGVVPDLEGLARKKNKS